MTQLNEQQTGRTIEMKTLVIAAAASVTAAIVTSFFWKKGTLISTALTPVIVALTQEALRRPAEKVSAKASLVTAPVRGAGALGTVGSRRAEPPRARFEERRLRERERGGGEAGAGAATNGEATNGAATNGAGLPPAPFDDTRAHDPTRSTEAGDRDATADTAPAAAAGQPTERTVYGRKRFRWKLALLTGLLAFGLAAIALTVSELALGESIGGDGRTSLFSGDGGGERSGADGSEGDGSSEDGSGTSDPAETQSVPGGDGGSEPAPAPEEEAPVEEPAPEEPAEPVEPAPVAPTPAE